VLGDEEFAAWGKRVDEILKPGGVFAGGQGTLPGHVWFMWGTVRFLVQILCLRMLHVTVCKVVFYERV
jgi:hypothetical protein